MGYLQPQRLSASSTAELNPSEFSFIAPLFVVDGIQHKDILDVFQDGSIMFKVRSSHESVTFLF